MIIQRRILRYRRTLELRKDELLRQRQVSTATRAPVSLDQQAVGRISRMDALQQQAMANAQEQQRTRELMAIERAFARIRDEVFGYCENCGEDIAIGRLKVSPSVALCVRCADQR